MDITLMWDPCYKETPHKSKKQEKLRFSWTKAFLKALVCEAFYILKNKGKIILCFYAVLL